VVPEAAPQPPVKGFVPDEFASHAKSTANAAVHVQVRHSRRADRVAHARPRVCQPEPHQGDGGNCWETQCSPHEPDASFLNPGKFRATNALSSSGLRRTNTILASRKKGSF